MADIYGDAGLIQYTQGGHTWLEIKNGVHLSQSGQGGFHYAEAFMVLPGSGQTAVKCYVDIWVFTRVNENLDAQMKIVPGNVIGSGCSGFYYPALTPGSSNSSTYRSIFITYPQDFRIAANVGTSNIDMTKPNGSIIFRSVQNKETDPDNAVGILRRTSGTPDISYYGTSSYTSNGRRYHWNIGYGGNAGTQGTRQRWSGSNLTSAWKSSKGWFGVGNLEKDFHWDEDEENFDGQIYFCGSAYYYSTYTYATKAVPKKVTIPGLKRLLDYYPWAINKSKKWMSLNRAGGHLKSREGSTWDPRKNRVN